MSLHRRIFEAMQAKLQELSWVAPENVRYEKIGLFSSDFGDHELPLIQIYDVGEESRNEQCRDRLTWNLAVELVMKKNVTEAVKPPQAQKKGISPSRNTTGSPKSGRDRSAMPSTAGSPMCTGAPCMVG